MPSNVRSATAPAVITGTQIPPDTSINGLPQQQGVLCNYGHALRATNVSVWGCQESFANSGYMIMSNCFSSAATYIGFATAAGGNMYGDLCGGFGGAYDGHWTQGVNTFTNSHFLMNARAGALSSEGGEAGMKLCQLLGNAVADDWAFDASTISMVNCTFGTTSPALGMLGNQGSIVTSITI